MRVELHGVELFGYHGVGAEERRVGQRFLYDVELEVGERGADDSIEHAVDYRDVARCIEEVAGREYRLLEALASALADALTERFSPAWLRVRVRKPEVRPAGVRLAWSAVTVERPGP